MVYSGVHMLSSIANLTVFKPCGKEVKETLNFSVLSWVHAVLTLHDQDDDRISDSEPCMTIAFNS